MRGYQVMVRISHVPVYYAYLEIADSKGRSIAIRGTSRTKLRDWFNGAMEPAAGDPAESTSRFDISGEGALSRLQTRLQELNAGVPINAPT